jgi:hypothetical protein
MSEMSLSVPLDSRRRERVQLFQKLQHVLPSVPLLTDGISRFGRDASVWSIALATAEVATSTLVLGAFVRALRQAQLVLPLIRGDAPHSSHRVDWVDILLSAMLLTEALVHRQETGHLPRPTILIAALTFVLGLTHGALRDWHHRRRALRISDTGLTVGGRFFTTFAAAWSDIARFELTPIRARIVTKAGATRDIDLTDLRNATVVANTLIVARERYEKHKDQHAEIDRQPDRDRGGGQQAQTD